MNQSGQNIWKKLAICLLSSTRITATSTAPLGSNLTIASSDGRQPIFERSPSGCVEADHGLQANRQVAAVGADQLEKAQASLEYARQATLHARKIEDFVSHPYCIDHQVKVSTEYLVPSAASTQRPILQPRYVGPFEIVEQMQAFIV